MFQKKVCSTESEPLVQEHDLSDHIIESSALPKTCLCPAEVHHDAECISTYNCSTAFSKLSDEMKLLERGALEIQTLISQDTLQACGSAVIQLIYSAITHIQTIVTHIINTPHEGIVPHALFQQVLERMDDCLRLSTEMFYAYKFSNVPLAWRRLYAYSSALKAMAEIGMHETKAKIIETLDMALIMTGGVDINSLLMELIDAQKPNVQPNHKTLPSFYVEQSEKIEIHFPIRCIQCPSLDIFQNDILPLQQPFVIKNSINHWPALSQEGWAKIDTLLNKTHQGLRIIPVEIGKNYTDETWGQKLMPFYEFLKKYILQTEETSDTYEFKGENIGYLAQHDLFSQIPALREDITIPDYCFTTPPPIPSHLQRYIKTVPTLHEPLLNAWFGSKGTISPLHTDPYHNILSQVVGWKYVRLYSPDQNEALYPRSFEEGIDMSNTSQVDLDNLDIKKFPKFLNAKYVENIIGPGDSLYIPASIPLGI